MAFFLIKNEVYFFISLKYLREVFKIKTVFIDWEIVYEKFYYVCNKVKKYGYHVMLKYDKCIRKYQDLKKKLSICLGNKNTSSLRAYLVLNWWKIIESNPLQWHCLISYSRCTFTIVWLSLLESVHCFHSLPLSILLSLELYVLGSPSYCQIFDILP